MREYVVNRPDEAAMRRVLEAEPISPEGILAAGPFPGRDIGPDLGAGVVSG